jgi:hypothetical protein
VLIPRESVLLYSPGTDTFLEDLTRNADRVFYFDEGPRAQKSPDHPGGLDMIKLLWKRGARPLGLKPTVNPRILELQTAKEILAEIFHARPSYVEEIIERRLE